MSSEVVQAEQRKANLAAIVRLGFAVAVHVRADILVVDEVLAVGDAEFQNKCFTHMEKLRDNGVTIVIASHDLYTVQRYTDHALLLELGPHDIARRASGGGVLSGRPVNLQHFRRPLPALREQLASQLRWRRLVDARAARGEKRGHQQRRRGRQPGQPLPTPPSCRR